MKHIFQKYYHSQTSIAPLITFRIIFGVMMLFSTIRFWALGWINDHFIDTKLTFKYYGFAFIDLLPPNFMYAIHVVLIVASLGVMLGYFYRISAILLFLTFTYCQLIDLTYYLNHYYFVTIVCLFLVIVPANRAFSLDIAWRNVKPISQISAWVINIFKLQIAIVYVYAGLGKINQEWLFNALPLKIWLPAADALPIIGFLMKYDIMPYLFSWGGMLYDTFIVFFLLNSKSRPLAYFTVFIFHVITGVLFQIGVFPLVMIGATLIFFSNNFHEKLLIILSWRNSYSHNNLTLNNALLKYALIIFFMFQLLFPWRYLLYSGNMFWTEQGYRFGWRVMLMEKAGTATFYVKDTKTGHEGEVTNSDFLNNHQEKQMAMQADMILQYAQFLRKHFATKGVYKPSVRAEIYVTLNGKPSKLLIDPNLDLTKIKDSWEEKKWIINR